MYNILSLKKVFCVNKESKVETKDIRIHREMVALLILVFFFFSPSSKQNDEVPMCHDYLAFLLIG